MPEYVVTPPILNRLKFRWTMLSMVVEPITAMLFSVMPGPEWFFFTTESTETTEKKFMRIDF
jgi:hypothetical protein